MVEDQKDVLDRSVGVAFHMDRDVGQLAQPASLKADKRQDPATVRLRELGRPNDIG
jgi:hypothetical protein